MMNLKIISIFVILISLIFSGCTEQKPAGTPVPTATPVPTVRTTTLPPEITPTPTLQPTSIPTPARMPASYIADIDDMYGFRKVTKYNGTASYANHTLTINAGDTVKWISVSDENIPLTVVSVEGLWNNSTSFLKYSYRNFNYTFNQPGTFEVYLKDNPRIAHQKIIVNP
jgi:plastocyanin